MNYDSLMDNIKRIHFIGIGGSGMCPLAEILHHEGYELSGSDMNEGETLDRIKGYGIPVFMGHAAENIKGAELVVYSAAIKETNPERQAAKELGIPCIERSVMLGIVTRRYRRSIAVSGTHGKTTTTAMLSQVLIGSGFDPSAIIGGKLPFIGGNSYVGHSDIIVCEACEYVDTFLQLNPFISIILNIDADHLDYFKNLDNIKKSFNKFAHQTTGLLVINGDDENTLDAVKDVEIEKITYGFGENCDYRAENISADKGVHEQFDLYFKGEKLTQIKLIVPGKHNIYNALAAAATAHYLGATPKEISENLHKFGGVHRRFEILGTPDGITVADDFAHHPTELTATLNAASQLCDAGTKCADAVDGIFRIPEHRSRKDETCEEIHVHRNRCRPGCGMHGILTGDVKRRYARRILYDRCSRYPERLCISERICTGDNRDSDPVQYGRILQW